MSSANKGKKSKSNRPSAKKSGVVAQSQNFEGAYANSRLVHVLLSLMGKKCQAKVRKGGIYEGIFHTFNPKMDVVLDAVHMRKMSSEQPSSTNGVDTNSVRNECPAEEELMDKMFFNCEKTVSLTFEDVDLSFADMDINKTNGDTTISQTRSNAKSGEKELELWNGGGDVLEDDSMLLGSSEGTNGWCATEMFRANEEKYGVKSDYDSSLSSYTMPLDMSNTNEEKVAWANKIAQEIESGSDYKQRNDLELDEGVSEEDKFSAVHRDVARDARRDSRDARDREREREHREYRDKDRGDRDPLSPQGFRGKNDSERFHVPNRPRGRGKDAWERRGQQGYTNPGMGTQRQMNQGGSASGGRSQTPAQMESVNQSGMGRTMHKTSAPLPPRFSNKGSSGHSGGMVPQREDDRMRQHQDNSMHHGYQQQKNRSQQRMARTNPGNRSWNNPMMNPPSEYPHHSPTSQMHQDPAVISASPSGGGPPLSRSSSNSSNAAAPIRKHPSSSSDDQQQHPMQHAPPPQQHPGIRVQQTSPSPGIPPHTSNQVPMTRPPLMPQINTMASPSLPGKDASWSSIVSGNMVSKSLGHGTEMQQQHVRHSHPHAAMAQHSQGQRMSPNVRFTYTPRGETPPGQPFMQGQMMSRPPPQQVPVTSPPQQQQQQVQSQQMATAPRASAKPQIAAKVQNIPPDVRHERNYTTDKNAGEKQSKKVLEPPTGSSQSRGGSKNRNGSPSFADLQNFGKNFKLPTDVKNTEVSASPTSPTSGLSAQRGPVPPKVPARQATNFPNVSSSGQPGPHIQQYIQTMPQQAVNYQQVYPAGVLRSDQGPMQPVAMESAQNMQNHVKQMVHSHPMTQMQQQPPPPQMPQQIPGAAAIIHNFAGGASLVTSHQQVQPDMKSPRTGPDATQPPLNRPQQHMPNDKTMMSHKQMMSPKQEGGGHPLHSNVNVVTKPPTQQANPPAVISVSSAPVASLVQYPSPVTSLPAQVHQSPTFVQVHSSEMPTSPPTTGLPKPQSVTSPTMSVEQSILNPDAKEFFFPVKRTSVVTARTPTPSAQQMQLYMPSTPTNPYSTVQVSGGMATQGQMTPVYNTMKYSKHGQPVPGMEQMALQQIYHHPMQPMLQHFTQVPQMPGQQVTDDFANAQSAAIYSQHALPLQMQQFATFEQAQMYGQAPQAAIMHQRPIPTTLQGHNMQQYQADQSHNTMYVTAAIPAPQGGMQSNYMQQTRPQSAHTPTQMPHVTAASPANTVSQQVQPHTVHSIQGMTPTHNIQQSTAVPQMWTPVPMATNNFMMVQSGHNPQHIQSNIPVNHPPPPAPQFAPMAQMPASISTSVAMSNVTVPPQQKGHQGAIAAAQMITQQNPRHYTGQ